MKILILRFSSIGDIVLTSPVLRCLKKQHPEYTIHYATKSHFVNLLLHNPYIDKIHSLSDDTTDLIKELKLENFDLIIDLHRNLRTKRIRAALKVKTYSLDKINWEKWLMVMLKINILPYAHVVDRYLETLRPLHVHSDGLGLDFFIDPKANLNGIDLPETYNVYALGAQHNTKKLPLNKQIELMQAIDEKVVLIGGKDDIKEAELLAQSTENTIDLCGKLNIHQSALVMQNSIRVYSHDTGMMHIAAALQKPIVSIWGNTIPEFGMTSYYGSKGHKKNYILEVKDLDCRPCSKIGFKKCPKGHFDCMELQDFSILKEITLPE
jgi:ADP-heptose:LPS heptosyltransferase